MTYAPRCPSIVYEVVPDAFDPKSEMKPLVALKERLPHIQALHVDAISLTPIFCSPEPMRLHTSDYATIDPSLGDEADLVALCETASALGIAIILTGVFDHVSDQHPWFLDALKQAPNDPTVPLEKRTRNFFLFAKDEGQNYEFSENNIHEPKLNLANSEVRRRLFTGERSVLRSWLQKGVTGWRLLRAQTVGYSILREVSRGSWTVEGNHYLLGDIKGFADRYVKDGLLDGLVNHYLREAILGYFRGAIPARQLARVMRDLASRYGTTALNQSWNILGGFDLPRLSSIIQEPDRMALAILLQYTLPGAAHIYYGDEIGLRSRHDSKTQADMSWDERDQNQAMLEYYQKLGQLRSMFPALREGQWVDMTPEGEEEIFAFARVTQSPKETVLVAVNRASQTRVRKLFAPVCDLPDGLNMIDALSGDSATIRSGTINVQLEGFGACVLTPELDAGVGADMFRGY